MITYLGMHVWQSKPNAKTHLSAKVSFAPTSLNQRINHTPHTSLFSLSLPLPPDCCPCMRMSLAAVCVCYIEI